MLWCSAKPCWNMQKYKSLVLPVALVAGYLLRGLCAELAPAVPYVIFAILVLTFSGVRLSRLRPGKLDLCLAAFQAVAAIALYAIVIGVSGNRVIAQGAMMCALCPVASSVTVVAVMLGADARRTTTYTIAGNLLVAVLAPAYISLIDEEGGAPFWSSFAMIFCKVAMVIAVPFFVMWAVQRWLPKVNERMARVRGASFYLWAFALLVTIGQTADFVVRSWRGAVSEVAWLGVMSLGICVLQFAVGRIIGRRYGDRIAGGQLLGQKNSAMGIWMLNTFLNPVASVGMAFYSIWQNLFNSLQIYFRQRSGLRKSA